jgi:hypothetical protein
MPGEFNDQNEAGEETAQLSLEELVLQSVRQRLKEEDDLERMSQDSADNPPEYPFQSRRIRRMHSGFDED